MTGTTTSGCVRATAVDGAGRHYRVLVVEDCVFDHRPISGPVALSDMADRYADIISLDAALAIVEGAAARARRVPRSRSVGTPNRFARKANDESSRP